MEIIVDKRYIYRYILVGKKKITWMQGIGRKREIECNRWEWMGMEKDQGKSKSIEAMVERGLRITTSSQLR